MTEKEKIVRSIGQALAELQGACLALQSMTDGPIKDDLIRNTLDRMKDIELSLE